ncbi:N-6 DNA methylase [Yersinia enterocolitica]|uniref:N-6 DNA methylase n=1 Tax=Yersinia enterocolitica TaxID=630 RepID=UPI0029A92236|nr:N-6 DNA methylase [Yersinia enterocolitica]EKN6243670.1 restriction endonuclease subunit M [Yersinia enterocolitica]HDL7859053.1 N-6 DNA methylase [Yersinia enterocolitica]HEI6795115.1 N-6 DNA methylase [Yersinia enterocolitica]
MKNETNKNRIIDHISGLQVKSGPEEIHAVQVFSKILMVDYLYPKELIQTRPQWRVKARPSDRNKEYPVDIAVFHEAEHSDNNLSIIIECKKPNRRDGRSQLEDYLRLSNASLGVWFNGEEKLFLRKHEGNGKVIFEEIPNIPKYGERVEDIGLYKRSQLKPAHNLKSVFRTVRNYLAANAVGITRDEVFAQQLINLIFCKIYDERFTRPSDTVSFRAGYQEPISDVKRRILDIFNHVKKQYNDVIAAEDTISLDDRSLVYIVGELQLYSITESERDAIADAFEIFIGPSLKGGQGQFFTPRNVVKLLADLTDPSPQDKIIDPSCGSGGFLIESLRDIWKKVEQYGQELGWPDSEIFSEKQKVAIKNIRGIDKDTFLSKVAKAYMAIMGDGRGGVFCENSLENVENWKSLTKEHIQLGSFDLVLTNPPFGKKLKIDDSSILESYNLGKKWKKEKGNNLFQQSDILLDGQSPQILFIERCLDLLKIGGRLGIIVPESMFCNPSHRYIVQYIKSRAKIKTVISLPEELFQPYTHAKTCAVVIENVPPNKYDDHEIFMAVANWCGHDSRGNEIPFDDIPKIIKCYEEYKISGKLEYSHFGFIIKESAINDDVYLPKYYNPEINDNLNKLTETHNFIRLGDLIADKKVTIATGDEVGKLAYGTGNIPFIRTSDIANWELKLDAKHGLSNEIYEKLKKKQDVRENDILMVRDGTYLIGTCALVTSNDTKIVYQSHIYKIRSNDHSIIHPYLLLAAFSSPIVKAQIFSKRFTQDIIDTLGNRITELILPIPKSEEAKLDIIDNVKNILSMKKRAKELSKKVIDDIASHIGEDLMQD